MNVNKFAMMGWVVAAALGGIMLGSGFQTTTIKLGVVDIANVVEQSNLGKKNQADFNAMKTAREGVLEFIDTYRVLTMEQATKLRDLSLKLTPTAAEKAELERLKADIIASDKKAKELSTKPSLTPEERTLIQEYAQRSQSMEQVAQRWYREFTNEMQAWADKQKTASIDSARASIQQVAKEQGFTIIFESGIAPYGANDISDASLKAMNAKQ